MMPRIKFLLFWVVVVLLSVCLPGGNPIPTYAADMQSYYETHSNAIVSIYSTRYASQGVKIGVDSSGYARGRFTLSSIDLWVGKNTGGNVVGLDLDVWIVGEATDYTPDMGNILASGSLELTETLGWVSVSMTPMTFNINTEVHLERYYYYHIVVALEEGDSSNYIYWWGTTTSGIAGYSRFSTDSGLNWETTPFYSSADYAYRIYGTAVPPAAFSSVAYVDNETVMGETSIIFCIYPDANTGWESVGCWDNFWTEATGSPIVGRRVRYGLLLDLESNPLYELGDSTEWVSVGSAYPSVCTLGGPLNADYVHIEDIDTENHYYVGVSYAMAYDVSWSDSEDPVVWSTELEIGIDVEGWGPSDLVVTNSTLTSISLEWTKNEHADETLVMYKVGGYPSTRLDGTQAYLGVGENCTVEGLDPGVTYYFRAWSYWETGGG